QNNRVICFGKANDSIRTLTKTKHPASVMMLGSWLQQGKKASIWFPVGYRLTAADYLMVLKDK
ncbi:Uncharacterized protein FKW44_012820, partial [Caligus rogercresseyi]